MNKFYLSFILSIAWIGFGLSQQQGGGMWIPTELNIEEMKSMGLKLDANEIFNSDKPAINHAIAHFGGGCTSEVISPNGLLLTNHHCGYGQIQAHSSVENDYLTNGFWAKSLEEELPNSGLTATFIINITDVTDKILQGTSDDMSYERRQEFVKSNTEIITENTVKEAHQDTFIRAFYNGNKYYQFITETYRDVRLVGTPPNAIGKFGGDTDNWSWPRHTGDFALFRIYADKNNKPADYSPDNVPYQPKHFLPINAKGVKEGDFTFVYGFPGRTNEYLPASAIDQIINVENPAKIEIRDIALDIVLDKMIKDDATRIKYASKHARIANYHKKWTGESLGLKKSGAIQIKKDYEAEFNKRINANPQWDAEYGNLLTQMNELYEARAPYIHAYSYFEEAIFMNSETFRMALQIKQLYDAYGTTRYDELKPRLLNYLKNIYRNYDADLDQEVSLALIELYKKNVPHEFLPDQPIQLNSAMFENSIITGKKMVNGVNMVEDTDKAFENDANLLEGLMADPVLKQVSIILEAYETKVSPKYLAINKQLESLQRVYMKAQLEVFPEKKIFPDANSTLRVTYGKVDGYKPEDKPRYAPITYLDEVIEKFVPGDFEFDVPQKLIDLEKNKNYGKYGVGKGKRAKMPVNFIASNHTTGGNSGSPALDKDGNLVGINFDRVWEGTMSDYHYDSEICRNIMVDMRYVLFIIDKYADAGYLLDEMKIIH